VLIFFLGVAGSPLDRFSYIPTSFFPSPSSPSPRWSDRDGPGCDFSYCLQIALFCRAPPALPLKSIPRTPTDECAVGWRWRCSEMERPASLPAERWRFVRWEFFSRIPLLLGSERSSPRDRERRRAVSVDEPSTFARLTILVPPTPIRVPPTERTWKSDFLEDASAPLPGKKQFNFVAPVRYAPRPAPRPVILAFCAFFSSMSVSFLARPAGSVFLKDEFIVFGDEVWSSGKSSTLVF